MPTTTRKEPGNPVTKKPIVLKISAIGFRFEVSSGIEPLYTVLQTVA